jgi:CD63 antigen
VLIAGCVVIADSGDYGHFLEGRITAMPVMLIIAGLLVFVIATLGCYGAVKENPKLLMTVSVILRLNKIK